MNKHGKNKTLKRLGKPCSDCESKETYLILKNKEIDGIIYPEKYIYCSSCECLEIFRDKKHKEKYQDDFQ